MAPFRRAFELNSQLKALHLPQTSGLAPDQPSFDAHVAVHVGWRCHGKGDNCSFLLINVKFRDVSCLMDRDKVGSPQEQFALVNTLQYNGEKLTGRISQMGLPLAQALALEVG